MANNNALLNGSPTINTNSVFFDGQDYAQCSSPVDLVGDKTVEVVYKSGDAFGNLWNSTRYSSILVNILTSTSGNMLRVYVDSSGVLRLVVEYQYYQIMQLSLNTMYTISVVERQEAGAVEVYVNGSLVASYTDTFDVTSAIIYIGGAKQDTGFTQIFIGSNAYIYAFRIYNRALTADEVQSNAVWDSERFN